MKEFLIGIDEAGRGPLAGPVAVGAVAVPLGFDWTLVAGAKDSKQMSEKAREQLYGTMTDLRQAGTLNFAVAFSSSTMIDQWGIVPAIKSALARALDAVAKSTENRSAYEIRLDGGLRAPTEFKNQSTIIRGDQSEPIISLASIAAKVERDRLMLRLAKKFPRYEFDRHKGYGTALHRASIIQNGLSPVHRRSFCKALISAE
ncbi:MAG TPA: ribonuclease HII [Candidatus Paceibacterota bacterium]|nr:ribonuclease HII [Candidatus Paceibacterota bacterium]